MEVGGGSHEEEEEEEVPAAVVYCAVGKDGGREWKANLRWVLANFPHRSRRRFSLVLAHVHRPPHRVNMSMFFNPFPSFSPLLPSCLLCNSQASIKHVSS